MTSEHDLVILGGGTGGYSCALRAAALGLSVALVEKAKVGGTCLHWGCIPTKAFLHAAEVAEHAATAGDYGVRAAFEGVDVPAVLEYKDGVVDANHKGLQASLKGRGVETIAGTGRMTDPRTLVVDTEEGERTVTAKRGLVIATGSAPKPLPVDGAEVDGDLVITSDEAMSLQRAPERPIVLGASAVGVEFATVYKGWGAQDVTIIEALDAVVPREDTDTSRQLAKDLRRRGITCVTGAMVTEVVKGDGAVKVTTESGDSYEGDLLMVAIGRGPVSAGMGLEEAGVPLDRGFVQVDGYCRTGLEWDGGAQYALGDVIPTLGLAHASFQEGMAVAEQVAGRRVRPIDYAGVPRVYYCTPEIGAVGYTEQELTEQGVDFESHKFPFSHNARAMMMKGTGHVKVLAAAGGGKVLGVHIVGPKATDLIAEGQLIYNWEALPTDVAEFIHPHPTLSEAVGEAHLALAGRALHG